MGSALHSAQAKACAEVHSWAVLSRLQQPVRCVSCYCEIMQAGMISKGKGASQAGALQVWG